MSTTFAKEIDIQISTNQGGNEHEDEEAVGFVAHAGDAGRLIADDGLAGVGGAGGHTDGIKNEGPKSLVTESDNRYHFVSRWRLR